MFWLTTQQLKSGSLNSRKKAAKKLWREPNPRALEALACLPPMKRSTGG
jgi:hypothetical protein